MILCKHKPSISIHDQECTMGVGWVGRGFFFVIKFFKKGTEIEKSF